MSLRGPIARRGAIAVWVAVLAVVFLGFVGLAMDAGVVLLAGSHLQIAADAGALAGARLVRAEDLNLPREAARAIAFENKASGVPVSLDLNDANAETGDIVIGRFYRFVDLADPPRCPTPPCFFPQLVTPNAVQVHARRTSDSGHEQVPLVFGAAPLFNVLGIDVTRSATAIIAGSTGAGLIVLCPDCRCALDFSGNTDLILQSSPEWGGDTAIQVNSDHFECAVCGSGNTLTVTAPEMNIVGYSIDECWPGGPTLDTYINQDSPSMPDPLAGLPTPSWGAPNNPGEIRGSGIFTPGYYPGGIKITASGDVVNLLPGIYVLDSQGVNGGGLYVNGGNLIALGVMFYVIGDGGVYLGGNGIIDIRPSGYDAIPPSTDDCELVPYCGISIFQARNNPTPATIIGTSTMNLQGTYYFPVAPVEIGGEGISIGNQMIAWSMWIHGRGLYTMQYDGRFPAPGSKVFLVQ